jgi:hypothetical protein
MYYVVDTKNIKEKKLKARDTKKKDGTANLAE